MRLDREVILHPGNVVSVLTIKLAAGRIFSFAVYTVARALRGCNSPVCPWLAVTLQCLCSSVCNEKPSLFTAEAQELLHSRILVL